ncbi:hypothetical protein [Ammonifex thiophilus]|uniref:Uncharacterized protein n=1 Tax=Ammonifex thiophilus TaxID=444093 RepID=A0A3D8P7N4_9THEO|nr:hypothetical protein [Ammonifex thiophilus]RDV84892.1 hypothetical protein DXX99_02305 [Ammonifex thiophilus]
MWVYARHPDTGELVPVGQIKDGRFIKKVRTRQKLRVMDAYGIDASVVEELRKQGVTEIELHEVDTGKLYNLPLPVFLEKAVIRSIGKFPPRLYLPLRYWATEEGGEESPPNRNFR